MFNMLTRIALALAVLFATVVYAQETSKDSMKDNADQKGADMKNVGKDAHQDRLQGTFVRSNKDKSILTVRKSGSSYEQVVHYDSQTQWVSQEHGSKKVNNIDASQVKDGDRVIVLGKNNGKEGFQATMISKRLTPQ